MKLTKQTLRKMIKEEILEERMGFSEEEYHKRLAGHYQTGIILMKMAQQMDKENRTETEHKVLDMSLGKYLKMLKKNFKLPKGVLTVCFFIKVSLSSFNNSSLIISFNLCFVSFIILTPKSHYQVQLPNLSFF